VAAFSPARLLAIPEIPKGAGWLNEPKFDRYRVRFEELQHPRFALWGSRDIDFRPTIGSCSAVGGQKLIWSGRRDFCRPTGSWRPMSEVGSATVRLKTTACCSAGKRAYVLVASPCRKASRIDSALAVNSFSRRSASARRLATLSSSAPMSSSSEGSRRAIRISRTSITSR
jgi:hypothetical protein